MSLPTPSEFSTFSQYLECLPGIVRQVLGSVQFLPTLIRQPTISDLLPQCHPSLLVCADGASDTRHGAYTWLVATQSGRPLVIGSAPLPCGHHDIFRAESLGLLAAVWFLHHYCRFHVLHFGHTISVLSDSAYVLRRVRSLLPHPSDTWYPRTYSAAHADVVTGIVLAVQRVPEPGGFKFHHLTKLSGQHAALLHRRCHLGVTRILSDVRFGVLKPPPFPRSSLYHIVHFMCAITINHSAVVRALLSELIWPLSPLGNISVTGFNGPFAITRLASGQCQTIP